MPFSSLVYVMHLSCAHLIRIGRYAYPLLCLQPTLLSRIFLLDFREFTVWFFFVITVFFHSIGLLIFITCFKLITDFQLLLKNTLSARILFVFFAWSSKIFRIRASLAFSVVGEKSWILTN